MTVAESVLDLVRVGMRGLKAPGFFDKVYKDECMYSFDTPESPGGLYVNLKSYQGFGNDYVELDHQKTGNALYADNLPQLDTGRKISSNPADWRCDDTNVTENLWLNLSSGHIGSGRQFADGSGGNGSALRHYEATGRKYPLVVKLGTITPAGADVYSYAPDEDDMVLDPRLGEHLAHWGINMMQMEKTAKTMAELEIDMNVAYEFSALTEAGAKLQQLTGPGHVGLVNLGNSCYMNSVLQVLFSLPELTSRYVDPAPAIFSSAPADPATDLPTQLAKVGVALVSGKTGLTVPPKKPTVFGPRPSRPWWGGAMLSSPLEGSRRVISSQLPLHIPIEAATNTEAVADFREREAKRQRLKEEQGGVGVGVGVAGMWVDGCVGVDVGGPAFDDGPGHYQLMGIISHMGSNTACGHYVAHVKKDGRWVIFNDEKVAGSEHPPLSLGYMYIYRRVCCQPLLDGAAVARSAIEVVRARITAALLGDVSYLVTTTHPDSILALGGSRNMRSLYRRQGNMFKSNKVKVVGMAHCRGDSDGTWVVLSILQSTVGEFAGVKVPFMAVVAKQNWQEGPAATFSELFADRKAQGSGMQYNNSMKNADDTGQWMFLESTTQFPDNSDSGVLVELIQQHVPELLSDTEDETGWQGHKQQSRMTGRQMCFIWDTPHLSIGFGHKEKQVAADGDADATGMGGWYVDLLQPAAEKFSKTVDVSSQGNAEADASPLLLPPGVFCMDEYLAGVAAQPRP
eukprot:gene13148-13278_t